MADFRIAPIPALNSSSLGGSRLAARIALGLLSLAALLLALAPRASAAEYSASPCSGLAASTELRVETLAPVAITGVDNCAASKSIVLEGNNAGTAVKSSLGARWVLSAPSFSEFREVEMRFSFPGDWAATSLTWNVEASGGGSAGIMESAGRFGNSHIVPSDGFGLYRAGTKYAPGEFKAGTKTFITNLRCEIQNCAATPNVAAAIDSLRVRMTDNDLPTIQSLGGSLLDPGSLSGTKQVTFTAKDPGSGVFFDHIRVDGETKVLDLADSNGGRCRQPFTAFVPCLRSFGFSGNIDTTELVDGNHTVVVETCDATSVNCAQAAPIQIAVANAPVNTVAPSIAGAPRFAGPLTASPGNWDEAAPATFSYKWLRCPASASAPADHAACTPIAGATAQTYTPVKADLGQRDMVEVTATLAETAGQATAQAFSPPSEVVAKAATATALQCAPASVKVGEAIQCSVDVTDPAVPGNRPTGSVHFSSDNAGGGFVGGADCKLPAQGANRCTVTYRATALSARADGKDAIKAEYLDDGVNAASSGSAEVKVGAPPKVEKPDAGAPGTRILKRPRKKTASRAARFTFSSDQPGSSFQCKLDRRPFKSCRSPFKAKRLKPGRHSFQVKAVNAAGAVDPTPAVFRWKVGRPRKK